nr:MAG TPA: hypothetical protein [Bacteriophage sp.]
MDVKDRIRVSLANPPPLPAIFQSALSFFKSYSL